MSEINSFSDYSSKYNANQDYSFLFGAAQSASTSGSFSLSDYASIKNGSYGKLLKAYYAKQDADKMSSGKDSVQKSTLMKSGESNSKDVLHNAVWLTGITESNENVLSKIGISIGKGNKMELDEETLKKAEIGTLKTLFTGHNSFASKVSMKANSISQAAARSSGTYKSNGTYNNALSQLASSKVDKEEKDKIESNIKEIDKLKGKIAVLVDLCAEGDISREIFRDKKQKIEDQILRLEQSNIEHRQKILDAEKDSIVEDRMKGLAEFIQMKVFDAKRKIPSTIIDQYVEQIIFCM